MVNELRQDGHQRQDALGIGDTDKKALPYRSSPRRPDRGIGCGEGLVHGAGPGGAQGTNAQPEQVARTDHLDRHEEFGRRCDDRSKIGEYERQEHKTAQSISQDDSHRRPTPQGDGTTGLKQDRWPRDHREHGRQSQRG